MVFALKEVMDGVHACKNEERILLIDVSDILLMVSVHTSSAEMDEIKVWYGNAIIGIHDT